MRAEEVSGRCYVSARLLLFLEKAVDFEPVRATAVAGTALGHAHKEAFSETARFASCSVLLVDNALAVVLALGDGADVVVGAAEERLEQRGLLVDRYEVKLTNITQISDITVMDIFFVKKFMLQHGNQFKIFVY